LVLWAGVFPGVGPPPPPAPGSAEVIDRDDLDAATRAAYDWARPDGVVLLSPAAPSFDRYHDYRARAAAFSAALTRLLRR
jgi:UDP-N-acetylmuramoyl-L-alanine---L-glutamate ligase